MKLTQYQIDSFAQRVFEGNPAAVCPLQEWLPDETLQQIAEENNLAETAFFVPQGAGYHLRWFTPLAEVDLCGHATLAAAHVIFEFTGHQDSTIQFQTRSGILTVQKQGDALLMDFPAIISTPCAAPSALLEALKEPPLEVLSADDYLVVYKDESTIQSLNPDLSKLCELDLRGVIVTAPSQEFDFVSRFFAPLLGVPEDPVTGSAHCALAPYWAGKLGKNSLRARQISKRGGNLNCEWKGNRVVLFGQAVTFLKGEIYL